jgi:hypothetical protein
MALLWLYSIKALAFFRSKKSARGMMLKDEVLLKDQKRNCIRFRPNESWEHVLRKTEICYWLSKNRYSFYTEAEFRTGGRADIVVYEPSEFIIEVVHTEKEKTSLRKVNIYPLQDIRFVSTKEPFQEKSIL